MKTKFFSVKSKVTKFFEYELDFALEKIEKRFYFKPKDKIIFKKDLASHIIICECQINDHRKATTLARHLDCKNTSYKYTYFICTLYNIETKKICNRKIVAFDDYI